MQKTNINWISKKKEGLYCNPGKFYIDPILPVEKALITHAHTDHARPNNKLVLSSKETLNLMKLRYGDNYCSSCQISNFSESININNVNIRTLPAGHILGSIQFLLEYKGYKLLISGDYKRTDDITCQAYEPSKCDTFITEATFGLPIFNHPDDKIEIKKLIKSLELNVNSTHLIGVYALGKCQRLISLLRAHGYDKTIFLHGALIKITEYYSNLGLKIGDVMNVSKKQTDELSNSLVLCPPSSLNDKWSQKFKNVIKGYVSGWMRIRQRIKQKNIELPLIISDHADWNEILSTVNQVEPKEVLVTHGREEALVDYLNNNKYKSSALNLIGFEDENE
ncbi:MAG: ligase-associated DNA damage response exonuclease [Alphaproteobacteria bacterium]